MQEADSYAAGRYNFSNKYLSNSARDSTKHCFAVKGKRMIGRPHKFVAQMLVDDDSSRSVERVPENSRR